MNEYGSTGRWEEDIEHEKAWKWEDQCKGGRKEFEEELKCRQYMERFVGQAGELRIDAVSERE